MENTTCRQNVMSCGARSDNRRPKLLFLAYLFPPLQTIACVRTWNIARYLSGLGWDVTVVAPDPSFYGVLDHRNTRNVDFQEAGIRRIVTGHRWPILLRNYWRRPWISAAAGAVRKVTQRLGIENSVGWSNAAEFACRNLSPDDVDVILATGPPYSAFRLARRLARRFGRPYVLDYRDPQTGHPYASRPPRRAIVNEEKELLQRSAAVTVVSDSWRSALDHRFGVGSKVHVVTNGYDPDELTDVQPHDFSHFAIVYTGIFRPPKRVITPLMAALQHLKRQTQVDARRWLFHYYGPDAGHVRQEAMRFSVTDRVVLHGRVPRAEALSAVRGAGVAVVINSTADHGTLDDRGQIPAKLFEALGLGTPILLIAPSNSDARTIVKQSSPSQSFTGVETEKIASFLLDLMRAPPKRIGGSGECYSWPVLSQRLDAFLKDVMENQQTQ